MTKNTPDLAADFTIYLLGLVKQGNPTLRQLYLHFKAERKEYLKNTQPGTTPELNVLETDKLWYGLVDSNKRQELI